MERRLTAGAPAIALVRDPAAARRTTGPRRVHGSDAARAPRPGQSSGRARPRGRPDRTEREATAEERVPDIEATPAAPEIPDIDTAGPATSAAPAASPGAAAPAAPAAAPKSTAESPAGELLTDGTTRPLPGAVTRHPRPEEHRPGMRSKDLQWLLSPDEADDLIRTSRTAPPKPAAPPARAPAAESPAPTPVPPVSVQKTMPSEPRVAAAPAEVERPAPQAKPAVVAAPVPARSAPAPWLRITVATAVVGAAVVVGWLTAPLLQRGPGVERAAVPAQPAPVEPSPQPGNEGPAAAVPVSPPVRQEQAAPQEQRAAERVRPQPVRRPAVTAPVPVLVAPAVGSIRGTVRDAASNAPLPGVRVSVQGTSLSATTDASGVFVIADVAPGTVSLAVSAADRPAASRDVLVQAGVAAQAEFTLEAAPPPVLPASPVSPVSPTEADEELAAGNWVTSDLAAAEGTLGIPLAVIPGLYVESVSVPESGGRPRVRIAQLTASGERIVLTETRAGAPVPGTPRVTALRIIPASRTYPLTTGTASFGNLLVTAKAAMAGDALRALLATLVVAGGE